MGEQLQDVTLEKQALQRNYEGMSMMMQHKVLEIQQLTRQLEMERSTTLSLVLKIEDLQARATGAEAANVRLTLLPVQLAELQATHDKLRVDATATGVKLEAANEHIARLARQVDRAEAEVSKFQRQLEESRNARMGSRDQAQELNTQLTAAQGDMRALLSELHATRDGVLRCSKQAAAAEQRCVQLAARVSTLEDVEASCKARIRALQHQFDETSGRNRALEVAISTAHSQEHVLECQLRSGARSLQIALQYQADLHERIKGLEVAVAAEQASWAVSQAAAVQARSLLSDTEDRLQQALSSSMVADEVMAAMQGQVAQARGAAAEANLRTQAAAAAHDEALTGATATVAAAQARAADTDTRYRQLLHRSQAGELVAHLCLLMCKRDPLQHMDGVHAVVICCSHPGCGTPTSAQEALTLAVHRSEVVWDKLSLAGSRVVRGLSDEQGRQETMLGGSAPLLLSHQQQLKLGQHASLTSSLCPLCPLGRLCLLPCTTVLQYKLEQWESTTTALEEQCGHLGGGLAALGHLSAARVAQQARRAVDAPGGAAVQGARVAVLEAELRTEQQAHANLRKSRVRAEAEHASTVKSLRKASDALVAAERARLGGQLSGVEGEVARLQAAYAADKRSSAQLLEMEKSAWGRQVSALQQDIRLLQSQLSARPQGSASEEKDADLAVMNGQHKIAVEALVAKNRAQVERLQASLMQVRQNVTTSWDASMLLLSDMVLVASGLAKLNVAVKDCLTGSDFRSMSEDGTGTATAKAAGLLRLHFSHITDAVLQSLHASFTKAQPPPSKGTAEWSALTKELRSTVAMMLAVEESLACQCTCLACLQVFTHPVMCVPCGHSYCRSCLQLTGMTCQECDGAQVRVTVPNAPLDAICSKYDVKLSALTSIQRVVSSM
ncbi:MAG: hypothetical protein WDW38_000745 [Sanguina aurantia]